MAAIPSILTMKRWIPIAACVTQITSIGYLRKPAIVAQEVREQKVQTMIRSFLLVQKIQTFVQDSESGIFGKETSEEPLTAYRRSQVESAFNAIDGNGDGHLDAHEFESLMSRLGLPVTTAMGAKIVNTLDMDGDGVVDLNEFLTFCESIMEGASNQHSIQKMSRDLFSLFDKDGSGNLSLGLNEFVKTLEAFNLGFSIEDIGEILHELDQDGNGSVSLAEFEDMVVKYFPEESMHESSFDEGSSVGYF